MSTKSELLLSRLPIQDNGGIIYVKAYTHPLAGNWGVDVTAEVKKLLKAGKIKRERKFGYGHSGRAGHTYFVKV